MTDVKQYPQYYENLPIHMEVEFKSNLSFDELLRKFHSVSDAVMAFETLMPIDKYDSWFREYGRKIKKEKKSASSKQTENRTTAIVVKPKITLDNEFERLMATLPQCIGMEIFRYLIPNPATITFRSCLNQMYKPEFRNYGYKYEQGIIADPKNPTRCEACSSNSGYRGYCNNRNCSSLDNLVSKHCNYLSRIPQKNGTARYYLTYERTLYYCNDCNSYDCNCHACEYDEEIRYESVYVGKNIENALYELFLNIDIYRGKNKNSRKKYVKPVPIVTLEKIEWEEEQIHAYTEYYGDQW
jgi:hypothetical protein